MNKNILVTGGAGFIGSNFIRYVLNNTKTPCIVNLDLLTYAGNLNNLKNISKSERYKFFKADICDQDFVENLVRYEKIDTIVHFAAETHVDRSILKPDVFVQTNVNGTFSLLEAAKKNWLNGKNDIITRFHFISTDEVFGTLKPEDTPFSETTPYAPNSPYSASKASADHFVRAYGCTYGLPISISNCSNNYGPYQFPEKLIPLIILNAIQNKPLPIYGDGKQIRDWLYVEDHCEAIWKILTEGEIGETYNIGGNNQPTNLAVVESICQILDQEIGGVPHRKLITFVEDRLGHDRRYAINSTKIFKELNWRPTHSLYEGLRKTVKWYLDNMGWIKKVSKQKDSKYRVNQPYKRIEKST